jgi:hypothetical protein
LKQNQTPIPEETSHPPAIMATTMVQTMPLTVEYLLSGRYEAKPPPAIRGVVP